jgi:hypothetical protein
MLATGCIAGSMVTAPALAGGNATEYDAPAAGLEGIPVPIASAASADTAEAGEILMLRPFRAVYRVSAGVLSGSLTLELEHVEGTQWQVTSVATTRGMARLFRRGDIIERSTLQFTANGVRPLEYTREDGISGADRDATLTFAHDDGRVRGSDREHAVDLPLNGEVIDRLSMQVLLMRDLTDGLRPEEYQVIDRGEIREMDVSYADHERISVSNRSYETLRLDHQSRNSNRSTRLWTAVDHQFLPVRIEQKRKGSTEWQAELQEVQWGEPAANAAASPGIAAK